MKIFITGGTGFIGRNLYEQLYPKYDLFTPDSTELNLLNETDVLAYLQKNSFDIIIHTATWNATKTSTKDTKLVFENNLRMFFNLARCSRFFKRMIYYGSGAEFDRNHWTPKMKEEYYDTFVPADQYGFSKYIMNKFTENSVNIYNLRLFGVYGKYEDWQIRFISQSCCRAFYNLPITINQNVAFDYTHVNDVIEITDWFVNNQPKYKSYNVCTGSTYTLLELAEKILAISGKKLPIVIVEKAMGREYSGDNTRLINEMNGFKFKKIDDCIIDLYNWYSLNIVDPGKL